ncbi:outer envelope pore protein 16-4, chloroplastic isoform X3 [Amborella trichopoda]|uniref:outer envelope pore protein 16-4, chloroplastic isoform X3 n=1 Tax=Amborella trichopoda TaxID=13333 RepID=UPI0009BE23EF|nr:outer envelope pore protein 16-4, chloroplastic isoform X3 [Amborella trichopoda]|eukprot:XP_020529732.1 outer envelope pore protein 16-4, chloroplastic isoform X3 [Amborella trichopoda]
MEAKRFAKEAPCSAVAVNAFVHLGMAGLAWGVVSGPYRADKRGLAGVARTTFLMKRVGTYSLLWGSLGGAFHAIRCGVRRYRMQEDWEHGKSAVQSARYHLISGCTVMD